MLSEILTETSIFNYQANFHHTDFRLHLYGIRYYQIKHILSHGSSVLVGTHNYQEGIMLKNEAHKLSLVV